MVRRGQRRGLDIPASDDGVRTLAGGYLVKSTQFRGFKKGDRVRVNPRQLKPSQLWMSGHIFDFIGVTTNIDTGKQWIDLFGGRRKFETWHAISLQDLVRVRNTR